VRNVKMVMAIVQNRDWPRIRDRLLGEGFRVTQLASTGGFLRQGNTTLLVGVEDAQVDSVVSIVAEIGQTRVAYMPSWADDSAGVGSPIEVSIGGGIMFVMGVERVERI
jgi:uncharacterized protein YaaQ